MTKHHQTIILYALQKSISRTFDDDILLSKQRIFHMVWLFVRSSSPFKWDFKLTGRKYSGSYIRDLYGIPRLFKTGLPRVQSKLPTFFLTLNLKLKSHFKF